ncbi:MAG TPA: response regulator [Myxococcaceae bacterium]|nr:response regulator [Myxococcaceae bacterium]
MKTLLIVDDEHAIVDVLQGLLGDEGYRVVAAANGREALARLSEGTPDLALVDVMMPLMGGRELVRAMAADPALAKIPVVMMSAAPRAILFPAGDDTPFAAFLAKPFDVEELLALIRRLLSQEA